MGAKQTNKDNTLRPLKAIPKEIELKPDDERAYYNRGSIYLSLGERDLAMQDFDKAIGCYDIR